MTASGAFAILHSSAADGAVIGEYNKMFAIFVVVILATALTFFVKFVNQTNEYNKQVVASNAAAKEAIRSSLAILEGAK